MNTREQLGAVDTDDRRITLRSFLLGALFSCIFAYLTVKVQWRCLDFTVTQIPVLPYCLLVLAFLGVNPLLKLIRIVRPFTRIELMVVFLMGMVSAGISTLGLASHLVPVMSSLYYGEINNRQTKCDIYIEPYVNEKFFVGGQDGSREAAKRLQEADAEWRQAEQRYAAARSLVTARQFMAGARSELDEVRRIPVEAERLRQELPAARRAVVATLTLRKAEEWWQERGGPFDPEDVVKAGPSRIAGLKAIRDRRQEELDAIKTIALRQVDEFRRGLTAGDVTLRAVPGFVWCTDEDFQSYRMRCERFFYGLRSLQALRAADRILAGAGGAGEAARHVATALQRLGPVADADVLLRQKALFDRDIEIDRNDLEREKRRVRELNRYRRYASAAEADRLDRQIAEATRAVGAAAGRIRWLEWKRNQILGPLKLITGRVAETRKGLESLLADLRKEGPADIPGWRARLREQMASYRAFDASTKRFLVGDIPWGIWARPLGNWASLILTTYLVLMTFNILIFRQWAHNEKIIYPLAELPATLGGGGEKESGAIPAIFRSGLFWTGVSIGAVVIGWNEYLVRAVPGLGAISLEWSWTPYIEGSVLDGLRPWTRFRVFFTLIGLTFLIPARISYSLWLFHVIRMLQILLLVWLGYGVCEESFANDGTMVLNFITAQGGGALIVFAAVIVWKCRDYLFCAFRARALEPLDASERAELKISSWLFMAGSAVLILLLHKGLGASLFYSLLYYFLIMIITIGLVRAVAEGGFLSYKCWFGPFHFVRSVFGMNHAWSAPSLLAPLFAFNSVLFMTYETCIAPAMANALKIRETFNLRRLAFMGVIIGGILCAFVVGPMTHIVMSYDWGADGMHYWFYRGLPYYVFGTIRTMAMTNPVDTAGGAWWMLGGGAAMVALLALRRHVFWIPHPIGLIMFVNPWMNSYWFSILLGWVFKVAVSKYGNKDTYARLRCLFIGLIVGEVLMSISGRALDTPAVWAR